MPPTPSAHGLLSLLLLAIAPAAGAVEIATPAPVRAGDPARLLISGEAACAVTADAPRRQQHGLEVRVRAVGSDCGGPAGPFTAESTALDNGPLWQDGVEPVEVRGRLAPAEPERLLGFALVEAGTAGMVDPEPGFWWWESGGAHGDGGPGIGIALERQGRTLSATVFGYDGDGRPTWLFGAGTLGSRSARIELTALVGGRGPFDPYRPATGTEPAGVLHLAFSDDARATAWFERAVAGAIELRPLSLVRFRFGDNAAGAWLGDWLLFEDQPDPRGAAGALWLRFIERLPTDDGFRLVAEGGLVLDCWSDPARPNSPPGQCTLLDGDGGALVEFDSTAVGRMQGRRSDGVPMRAIRRDPR